MLSEARTKGSSHAAMRFPTTNALRRPPFLSSSSSSPPHSHPYQTYRGGGFGSNEFEWKVDEALTSARNVLDADKKVKPAGLVDHAYADKYALAEALTNTTAVAFLAVLQYFGLTKKILRDLAAANKNKNKNTTLRFAATDTCIYAKHEVVDVPVSPTTIQTEKGWIGEKSLVTKIVKREMRVHYKIQSDWELSVYSGTDVEHRIVLAQRRSGAHDYVQKHSKEAIGSKMDPLPPPPFPRRHEIKPIELDLTWLLRQIDAEESRAHFSIDTSANTTKTPVRNSQIEEALNCAYFTMNSARRMSDFISNQCKQYGICSPNTWHHTNVFVPVIPVLVEQQSLGGQGNQTEGPDIQSSVTLELSTEKTTNGKVDSDGNSPSPQEMIPLPSLKTAEDCNRVVSPLLSGEDTTRLLEEHSRSLSELQSNLERQYFDLTKDSKSLEAPFFSTQEALIRALSLHTVDLMRRFALSIKYLETMLEDQLIKAIGKKVTGADLDSYMRYHNVNFLVPECVPERFCYAIRRPGHAPDGIFSIEEKHDRYSLGKLQQEDTWESISTHVREVGDSSASDVWLPPQVSVPLNAVTTLKLTGETYLHGWLNHRLGPGPGKYFRLAARAREFSSFVLLIGTMASETELRPRDAIVLRNKDEVHIPLLLNEIPTKTEFETAIQSLSPEQQRFASSFRSMQLDSSILGVCVIQIKPQLERLLGLPQDALTKEMKLTQDLMELFIDYQVPSDLVSCDLESGSSVAPSARDSVANVREHVDSVLEVIALQKKGQLEEEQNRTEMKLHEKFQQRPLSFGDGYAGGRPPEQMSQRQSARRALIVEESSPYDDNYSDKSFSPPLPAKATMRDQNSGFSLHKPSPSRPKQQSSPTTTAFSRIPRILDRAIERHDRKASIRSTVLKTASNWTRNRRKNLMSDTEQQDLSKDEIDFETNQAFDLLDALSRSGCLDINSSELHVLVCVTHRFEKDVMETLVQDNINPIEKLKLSTLLMASTILDVPANELVRDTVERQALEASFPLLLEIKSERTGDGTMVLETGKKTEDNTRGDGGVDDE